MTSTRLVIAVDVGGTKIAAALMRVASQGNVLDGDRALPEIVARAVAPTDVSSEAACLESISASIDGLKRDAESVAGIGIGLASLVDVARGRAMHSVHLPLADVPVAAVMERRHGVPVVVDNDATAACIGEHVYGAGRGCRHMLMLTLGTGVGGGIIVDGRPYRGAGGSAAELGHIMIDVNGPQCPGNCPNHGCLEAYVSGTAMATAARKLAAARPGSALGRALAAGAIVDGRSLTEAAESGDVDARATLREIGEFLGAGLVTLVNAFNPEVISVGGGAAAAGELLLAPARRVVGERALPPSRSQVRIVQATLGPDAALFGACVAIVEHLRAGEGVHALDS